MGFQGKIYHFNLYLFFTTFHLLLCSLLHTVQSHQKQQKMCPKNVLKVLRKIYKKKHHARFNLNHRYFYFFYQAIKKCTFSVFFLRGAFDVQHHFSAKSKSYFSDFEREKPSQTFSTFVEIF